MMKTLTLAAFALTSVVAAPAAAQTPAAPQVTHGAAIAGVCVFHNERMLAQSTAGQALQAGMQRLLTEVQGELQPYATSIQTEAQQLQQGGQTADPDGTRRQALQQRAQEAAQLEQTRERELQYTRQVQLQTITQAADPIVLAAYQARGCSLLLDRNGVFVFNPEMDITDTVIQQLNTALPTISFNRLQVPAQAPQQ